MKKILITIAALSAMTLPMFATGEFYLPEDGTCYITEENASEWAVEDFIIELKINGKEIVNEETLKTVLYKAQKFAEKLGATAEQQRKALAKAYEAYMAALGKEGAKVCYNF